MKLLLLTITAFFSTLCFSQKSNLTFEWKFINVNEGYNHDNKCEVYVDNKLITTSGTTKQTQKNTVKLTVPKGTHNVQLIVYALYEGQWEVHSIENNYSIDAIYETELTFKKKKRKKISLEFNLDSQSVYVKGDDKD